MLAKRIIPCLDVKDGKVVKGVKFRDHQVVGDIVELAQLYSEAGADELVFYDITASSDRRTVDRTWVERIAKKINIPFCVAGGIRTFEDAKTILNAGADKISINSPALENPDLVGQLATILGSQCVVVGIDSIKEGRKYKVCQYTGDVNKSRQTPRLTLDWVKEVQERGAGEIVLNCMDSDGVRQGYDIEQLSLMRSISKVPLIASGGAGDKKHFLEVFSQVNIDGALAASVFHSGAITIPALKEYLALNKIEVRLCRN